MRPILLLPLAVLALGACEGRFNAQRDVVDVAECYAAFTAIGIDADEPALGFSPEQQQTQSLAHRAGVERMQRFTDQAIIAAGGNENFISLAAQWRVRPEFYLEGAETPEAKQAAYQAILLKASGCHQLMNGWGASKAKGVLGVSGP